MGSFLVLIQNERLAIVTLEPSSANPQVLFKVSTAGKRAPSFRVNQHLLREHKKQLEDLTNNQKGASKMNCQHKLSKEMRGRVGKK